MYTNYVTRIVENKVQSRWFSVVNVAKGDFSTVFVSICKRLLKALHASGSWLFYRKYLQGGSKK